MNGRTFRIRRVGIDTWRENVASLSCERPVLRAAGVDLLVRLGDSVLEGQPQYRLNARFDADLGFSRRMALQDSAYVINAPGELPRKFVGGADLS